MNRLFLQVAAAVITLVVGAGFHKLVVALTEVAVRYENVLVEEPSSTIDSSEVEWAFFNTRYIVISLADRRDVYLGEQFVGNPDNTSKLEAKLQSKFGEYGQALMHLQPKELNEPIRLHPDYRMVCIKASTRSSYGDVVRLIEAAKRAGADRIRLVADKRKKRGSG